MVNFYIYTISGLLILVSPYLIYLCKFLTDNSNYLKLTSLVDKVPTITLIAFSKYIRVFSIWGREEKRRKEKRREEKRRKEKRTEEKRREEKRREEKRREEKRTSWTLFIKNYLYFALTTAIITIWTY
jgi:flagellar biosynthesis component FlhA